MHKSLLAAPIAIMLLLSGCIGGLKDSDQAITLDQVVERERGTEERPALDDEAKNDPPRDAPQEEAPDTTDPSPPSETPDPAPPAEDPPAGGNGTQGEDGRPGQNGTDGEGQEGNLTSNTTALVQGLVKKTTNETLPNATRDLKELADETATELNDTKNDAPGELETFRNETLAALQKDIDNTTRLVKDETNGTSDPPGGNETDDLPIGEGPGGVPDGPGLPGLPAIPAIPELPEPEPVDEDDLTSLVDPGDPTVDPPGPVADAIDGAQDAAAGAPDQAQAVVDDAAEVGEPGHLPGSYVRTLTELIDTILEKLAAILSAIDAGPVDAAVDAVEALGQTAPEDVQAAAAGAIDDADGDASDAVDLVADLADDKLVEAGAVIADVNAAAEGAQEAAGETVADIPAGPLPL